MLAHEYKYRIKVDQDDYRTLYETKIRKENNRHVFICDGKLRKEKISVEYTIESVSVAGRPAVRPFTR